MRTKKLTLVSVNHATPLQSDWTRPEDAASLPMTLGGISPYLSGHRVAWYRWQTSPSPSHETSVMAREQVNKNLLTLDSAAALEAITVKNCVVTSLNKY